MQSFSQRNKIEPINETMQLDHISEGLRNRLWNVIHKYYFSKFGGKDSAADGRLLTYIWDKKLKKKMDEMHHHWFAEFEGRFFSIIKYHALWSFPYDLMEWLVEVDEIKFDSKQFIDACNQVLEEELSAYRFVGKILVRITEEEELAAISSLLQSTSPIDPIKIQISSAFQKYSDRQDPDYRNAIKDAINAVESICKLISGAPGDTLALALKKLTEKGVILHPYFIEGIKNFYHYTCDSHGIRHGLMDLSVIPEEDTRYMLLMCTSFINYLIVKAQKTGILK